MNHETRYPLFNKPSSQVEAKPLPSNGTITSEKAAESVDPTTARAQRQRILDLLIQHPEGLTDGQIEDMTGIDDNAVRPRRWQLVRDGLVFNSGETRVYGMHKAAVVWKAKWGTL